MKGGRRGLEEEEGGEGREEVGIWWLRRYRGRESPNSQTQHLNSQKHITALPR
jgi:hypothetical protein